MKALRVSIEGNIGSGKSSVLAALATALPDCPVFAEPVDEWTDLLDIFYASPAEWGLAFSLKVLLSFRKPAKHDTCLIERSPLACRHVFSQLLYNDGSLTQHEWDLFKEYFDLLAWTPDVIVYIDTPVDLCMERIQVRGRTAEKSLDAEYLNRIEHQYTNMLRFVDVPIVRLDGTLSLPELQRAAIDTVTNIFCPTPQ
jgi:deoxyadenosine/deoxycytidine kinase